MSDIRRLIEQKARELFPSDPASQAHFVTIVEQESNFRPNAVNTSGEYSRGMFQFGKDLSSKYGVDEHSSPEAQAAAGGDYIKGLYAKHGGDWTNVLAEYNLGLPKYQKYISGHPDESGRAFSTNYLPAHERLFSRRSELPDNPEQSAFTLAPVEPAKRQPTAQPTPDPYANFANWPIAEQSPSMDPRAQALYQLGMMGARLLRR